MESPAHATCYRAQCFQTMKVFVKKAEIPENKYSDAFQLRLGRDPWLKPYTDHELERLAKSGVKKLLVICPAFVSDCLETIEEIGMRGRDSFLNAGRTEFTMIPCLNEHPLWIEAFEKNDATATRNFNRSEQRKQRASRSRLNLKSLRSLLFHQAAR